MQKQEAMISVRNLKMYFPVGGSLFEKKKTLKAVDDVSFDLYPGETFGLVGESGCGKTTVGRTIVRLYQPTAGQILLDGTDIAPLNEKEVLPYRSRMQMIFQDPYASLNPRMTVASIVGEPLRYQGMNAKDIDDRVRELVECVGLKEDHLNRYPHEFSGGQRQRIGIARAIVMNPELIIADEPVSALDVSIQAQVINLLNELREEMKLTILFIAHDLSVVKYFSDRIIVMYFGRIVEIAQADELFAHPLHPYTQSLLSAIPLPDPHDERQRRRTVYVPGGAQDGEQPELREVAPGHLVSCTRSGLEACRRKLGQA